MKKLEEWPKLGGRIPTCFIDKDGWLCTHPFAESNIAIWLHSPDVDYPALLAITSELSNHKQQADTIESLQAEKANLEADRIFDASKIKRLTVDKAELVDSIDRFMKDSEDWEGHPSKSDVYPVNGDAMEKTTIAFMKLYEAGAKHSTSGSDEVCNSFQARDVKEEKMHCKNCGYLLSVHSTSASGANHE